MLQIQRTAGEGAFAVNAYCFMPDHLHLAVEGQHPDSDLRRFVKVAKQRVAYVARTEFQIQRIWQDGYFERVLRTYESVDTLMRCTGRKPDCRKTRLTRRVPRSFA